VVVVGIMRQIWL